MPSHLGAPATGTDDGPLAVATAFGLQNHRQVASFAVVDVPTGPYPAVADLPRRAPLVGHVCASVAREVGNCLDAGLVPLVLHGDDSSVYGIGTGLLESGEWGIVYADAHGDANTPTTSPSGCLFGMGVALLLGVGIEGLAVVRPIAPSRVWYVGTRSLDPGEAVFLRDLGVTFVDWTSGEEAAAAINDAALHAGVKRLWLHVDHDVIDPAESGACLCREPGGLSAEPFVRFVSSLAAAHRPHLDALSMGNYLPSIDHSGRTLAIAGRILDAFGLATDKTL